MMERARILIADDDQSYRHLLVAMLQLTNHEILQASNGEEALHILSQTPIDVLLSDIVMPEVDGLELLWATRQLSPAPIVILLTAQGTLDSAIQAVRNGAFDYLLKPCSAEMLLRCVDRAVRRSAETRQIHNLSAVLTEHIAASSNISEHNIDAVPTTERSLRVGDLVIGTSHYHVTQGERTLQLTPTEYLMLRDLAEHVGQVRRFNEVALRTHNLRLDQEAAANLLRTHFFNLRRKLADGLLIAERGIGFRLLDDNQK